ncbi:ATP-binding protein [Halopelagius longus]|uniref:histidine kinase n=1 Tax=Halopelagius longus TaxID=1236180 RepID=A0A1H1E1B8_9EURY|nr:GAF domain-containing protein [Halopelagius longus]RDI71559.1 PAS domain S-box protein [Halopelagius longus]SDQ82443.1 PAS domain S-box-containing protein [Halopelagius longus]
MTTVLYVSGDEERRRSVATSLQGAGDGFTVREATPDDVAGVTDVPRADGRGSAADAFESADCVVIDLVETGVLPTHVRDAGYRGPILAYGPEPYDELERRARDGFTDVVRESGAVTAEGASSGDDGGVSRGIAVLADRIARHVAAEADAATTGRGGGREEILTRLHETNRELLRAGDTAEVAEITVRTASEVLELDIAVFGAHDPEERRIDPIAASDAARELVPELLDRTYGPETNAYELFRAGEPRLFEDTGDRFGASARLGPAIVVPLGEHGLLLVGSTGTERRVIPPGALDLTRLLAANAETALDRAAREAALREERDRIAVLFRNASDAIIDVEYVDGEPIVRSTNPAFEEVFGYDESTVVGENIDDVIVLSEDRETANDYNRDAVGGAAVEREVRRKTAHGTRDFLLRAVPLDPDGGTNRVYGIYTDITDRKHHERTLNSLHETARRLMRAETPEEVAEVAIDDIEDILGYPIHGLRLYDEDDDALVSVAASDRTLDVLGERPPYFRDENAIWKVFDSGEPAVFDSAAEIDDAYDRTGVGSVMYVPLSDHGVLSFGVLEPDTFDESDVRLMNLLGATVEAALDRAERTQLLRAREAELERQNDRLEEFASVVSHDLRNPLSVARGYLDLASETCDSPEAADHFERIERAHERMAHLISDLLSLARQGQAVGETEPTRVAELAERSWRVIATGDATLDVTDPPTVDADPERLTTILENLFRNSVEHGSASNRLNGITVRVGALDDGEGFFVEDDGVGVPAEHRENAFERGFSTGEDGTGFGLSIVRGIAEAHDWEVTLTDSDEGGARFEIRTR